MSAEIIDFQTGRSSTGISDLQTRQAERNEQHQLANERHRLETVQKVRSAADKSKKFDKRDDEIAPAQAINRLMAEAKAKKIRVATIREELAKKSNSTLHLERLRVDHTIDPAEAKKQASNNLILKVQPYVRVLDVLAELLDRSPDEVIFDAFRETTFFRSATITIDDPSAGLSWLLNEMANWVIRASELEVYFQDVRRADAGYDAMTDEFLYGQHGAVYQQEYEGGSDISDSPHALPAIPLMRIHRATFAGKLDVERCVLAGSEQTRAGVAVVARRTENHQLGPTESRDAEIALFSDVRLVIGPRTRQDYLGALFEVRSYVAVWTEGKARQLTFDLGAYPLYARNDTEDCELAAYVGLVAAQFDDGWRRITGFGRQGWKLTAGKYWLDNKTDPASPAGPADRNPELFGVTLDEGVRFESLFPQEESYAVSQEAIDAGVQSKPPFWKGEWAVCWYPVNPTTVNELMQILSPDRTRSPIWQLLFETGDPKEKPVAFHFSGWGCRQFETYLFTGGMETTLAAECDRLKRKLAECIEKNRALLDQQSATLLARWRKTNQEP